MAITVLKNNLPQGPFTRAQVAERMHAGEFTNDDLAFAEGFTEWTPLRQVLAKVDASLTPAQPPAVPPAYSYAASMTPPAHLTYAGFWLRFAAYWIDGFILMIPAAVILVPLVLIATALGVPLTQNQGHGWGTTAQSTALSSGSAFALVAVELLVFAILIGIQWLYFALLESGVRQATYGKRVLNIRVTDLQGARITFGRATGRFFGKILLAFIPCGLGLIGYIMVGFTEKKQALHDMIASTLVVRD